MSTQCRSASLTHRDLGALLVVPVLVLELLRLASAAMPRLGARSIAGKDGSVCGSKKEIMALVAWARGGVR